MLTQVTYDAIRPALSRMLRLGDEAAGVPLPTLLNLYDDGLRDWFMSFLNAPASRARAEELAAERKAWLDGFSVRLVLDGEDSCKQIVALAVSTAQATMRQREADLGRAFHAYILNLRGPLRTYVAVLTLFVFLPELLCSPQLAVHAAALNATLTETAPEIERLLAHLA